MLNPGEPRLPNELLSRAEMRETPPHILLTNYAMLEYLLLRPADLDLFEGAHGGHWSFIAVDEAHVYDGAKAAELAMLLRRLRDRVAGERSLRCIATSATVGDDPQCGDRVRAAAVRRRRSSGFPGDPSRQDLVGATRRAMPEGPFWGPLDPASYLFIARSADPEAEVLRLAEAAGVDRLRAMRPPRSPTSTGSRTCGPCWRNARARSASWPPSCSTRASTGTRPWRTGHRGRPGTRQLRISRPVGPLPPVHPGQ